MSDITFTAAQKQKMVQELQDYFEQELDFDLGQFDADFLLDFISNKFGAVYYNQGVRDAQTVVERKMLDISDELYQIEQETDL